MIDEYLQETLAIAETVLTFIMSFAGHGDIADGAIVAIAMGAASATIAALIVLPVLPLLALAAATITIIQR